MVWPDNFGGVKVPPPAAGDAMALVAAAGWLGAGVCAAGLEPDELQAATSPRVAHTATTDGPLRPLQDFRSFTFMILGLSMR